jgi:PIN domain nuclease of toxin-antitoxin system
MTFVADTHALVWHLTDRRRLGRAAERAFRSADVARSLCYVPAVSLVEISLLYEKGRLRVGLPRVLETLAGHAGYAVLALDVEQAIAFASFPAIRDPMDRLILAAARATGSKLVSADGALDGHGVERIWD